MKKLHQTITLTLVLACATAPIYGQNPPQEDAYSSAYMESSNSAHWSVYIPIAILVGAAIWWGIADRHRSEHDSSDSQDALGRPDSSKRISKFCVSKDSYGKNSSISSSSRYKRSGSNNNSHGSYSHQ